jgi:hypothetical protein
MNDIDLNIDNYSFVDILNLFKINKNFTDKELKKCKEVVEKIHPSNSSLDILYYQLFNNAYDILQRKYDSDSIIINENKNVRPYIFYNKENKEIAPNNTCYTPPSFSTRLVTFHTEDRDILKYPNENLFELNLPSVIKNTMSIELFDITLPTFYYNISEYLQNTKMWFSIPFYFTYPIELTIPSGHYTHNDLATELAKQLNDVTTSELFSLGVYVLPSTQYTFFSVTFNSIERKFTFHNTQDKFILWFDIKSTYDNCHFDCWKMLSNWGLGYNLGFYKKVYEAVLDPSNPSSNIYIVTSPKIAEIDIYNTIYMEIDTFNWIDEINPYSISTTDFYNNDFNGNVNNAFAKLILSNVSKCYIPVKKFKRILPHVVEKIGRLKFKFRYHNGILVDFEHQPFNFSLKFECRFTCST